MDSWLEVQKEILRDQEFIAEIEIETLTLTRFGGYKTTPYSSDLKLFSKPDAKSLKGVWRWWARLAVVGAFGKNNYKMANKYLNEIFGGTKEGTSLFRLEISDVILEDKLIEIHNIIDDFYSKVKKFLTVDVPRLKEELPQNTTISVSLNPSDLGIRIKTHQKKLYQYKDWIDAQIGKGSLKDHFIESKLTLKGKRIVCGLQFPEKGSKKPEVHEIFYKLNYSLIPRARLLLMPSNGENDEIRRANINSNNIKRYLERIKEEMAVLMSKGLKFKILLYGTKESDKVNFALSSLLLSLILGGIGSITKRAFGSLKLLSFKFGDDLEVGEQIRKIFTRFSQTFTNEVDLKKTLYELCKITVNQAKKLSKSEGEQVTYRKITSVPSLSNIRIEVIKSSSCDLLKIGEAFVKQKWKLNPKEGGRDLHTWILGLPRWQRKTKTGYAIKKDGGYDEKRRVSSIGARCFRADSRDFIILFGLLSQDWPGKELLHVSRGQPDMSITSIPIRGCPPHTTESFLKDVFDVAFEKVSERVCKDGAH